MNIKKQNKKLLERITKLEQTLKEILDSCSCIKLNLQKERNKHYLKQERIPLKRNFELIEREYRNKIIEAEINFEKYHNEKNLS